MADINIQYLDKDGNETGTKTIKQNGVVTKKKTEPIKVNTNIKKGFCTYFKRTNNKPIMTFNTVGEFTEQHGIAMGVIKGMVGVIEDEIYENLKGYFTNKVKEVKLTKEADKLMKIFDKEYRVLVGDI